MSDGLKDYELQDDGRTVCFRGELLAFESSEEDAKSRWLEMELYHTEGERYIISFVPRTRMVSEEDFGYVKVCETAADVIARLKRKPKGSDTPILQRMARNLLATAAEDDPEIRAALAAETATVYVA